MTKNSPTPGPEPHPNPGVNLTKVKRVKKKKRLNRSVSSSSSESDAIVPQLSMDESSREMYYDAHESYHALPENQIGHPTTLLPPTSNPLVTSPAAGTLMIAYSEHGPDPKVGDQGTAATALQGESTGSEVTDSPTINKPTAPQ